MTVTNAGLLYRWLHSQRPASKQPQHSEAITDAINEAGYVGFYRVGTARWRQPFWLVVDEIARKRVEVRS